MVSELNEFTDFVFDDCLHSEAEGDGLPKCAADMIADRIVLLSEAQFMSFWRWRGTST